MLRDSLASRTHRGSVLENTGEPEKGCSASAAPARFDGTHRLRLF